MTDPHEGHQLTEGERSTIERILKEGAPPYRSSLTQALVLMLPGLVFFSLILILGIMRNATGSEIDFLDKTALIAMLLSYFSIHIFEMTRSYFALRRLFPRVYSRMQALEQAQTNQSDA